MPNRNEPPVSIKNDANNIDRRNPRLIPLSGKHKQLSFSVKIARNDDQLFRALAVRRESYSKHHPSYADIVAVQDKRDMQSGSLVLVAESKVTGEALGTMRIETNQNRPLQMEADIRLPKAMRGAHLAHVSRMATLQGPESTQVKFGLFKALYLYSIAKEIDYLLVATIPPLERLYYRIGFKDLNRRPTALTLSEYGAFPMQVLRAKVSQFERETAIKSPMLNRFVFHSVHSDIKIFESVSSRWERPRT
jgi:hypothetical protein